MASRWRRVAIREKPWQVLGIARFPFCLGFLCDFQPCLGDDDRRLHFLAQLHRFLVRLVAFLLGLMNAVLVERSGSIWPAVVAHATLNTSGLVAAALLL